MQQFSQFGWIREHILFAREFLNKPVLTGAIAPSSSRLADLITEGIQLHEADTIIELGAGTGSFTRAIEKKAHPQAVILAFETNPDLAKCLRAKFSRVVVINDSVEHLAQHLASANRTSADCIISGIPWAGFSREHQERLMAAVTRAMRPGARFATFAYLNAAFFPPGRRFRKLLLSSFRRVTTTRTEWLNVPPAFVYRCEK